MMAKATDLPTNWATGILSGIDAVPGTWNVGNLEYWNETEGGATYADDAHYNPFNTTEVEPGSVSINDVGVQSYPNWTLGLEATLVNLNSARYAGIKAALVEDVPLYTFAVAVNDSEWGTHFDLTDIAKPEETTKPKPVSVAATLVGSFKRYEVPVHTDTNGNGYTFTEIPWSNFLAATVQGSDPNPDADNVYWLGNVHVQDRTNNVLVSVTSGRKTSTLLVFVVTI